MSKKTTVMRFFLPNGAEIPFEKVDSVKKAWGGKVLFSHAAGNMTDKHLVPADSNYVKKQQETDDKLDAMLNRPAPSFSMYDISRKKQDLAGLRGRVIVLNFWFVHCGGCVAEMPALNALHQTFVDKPVAFLSFALDDMKTITKFLQTHSFTYVIIPSARKIHDAFNIFASPVSMVIEQKGIIRFIQQRDNMNAEGLSASIRSMLQ